MRKVKRWANLRKARFGSIKKRPTTHDTTTATPPTKPSHILIYSFIHPLAQRLKFTSSVRDLTPDIMSAIINIHKQLPNEYIKTKKITKRIINNIAELIKSEMSKSKIFFLPVLPICSTFDLTKLFKNPLFKSFATVFINPSFSLMMQQVVADYKESSFRLTINQDLSYILKNYDITNSSTTHAVSYSVNTLKESMHEVKSAFINENDFNETIDLFHQTLTSGTGDHILFSHMINFTDIFDLPSLETQNLDKLSSFISELVE